jgi:hypothetical protein
VIFATILERIFFKSTPSVLSVVGTLIIVTSALYVAVSISLLHIILQLTIPLIQLTKEQTTKTKPSIMTLETIHEEELEEGLLERTRDDENLKNSVLSHHGQDTRLSPKPEFRRSSDTNAEETSALSPKEPAKALS